MPFMWMGEQVDPSPCSCKGLQKVLVNEWETNRHHFGASVHQPPSPTDYPFAVCIRDLPFGEGIVVNEAVFANPLLVVVEASVQHLQFFSCKSSSLPERSRGYWVLDQQQLLRVECLQCSPQDSLPPCLVYSHLRILFAQCMCTLCSLQGGVIQGKSTVSHRDATRLFDFSAIDLHENHSGNCCQKLMNELFI